MLCGLRAVEEVFLLDVACVFCEQLVGELVGQVHGALHDCVLVVLEECGFLGVGGLHVFFFEL